MMAGSVAEWLACWTQAHKARVQIAVAMLLGNSLKQTANTHCAPVHQAAKLVAVASWPARQSCCRQSLTISAINYSGQASKILST